MLNFRINRRKTNKTSTEITIEKLSLVDFENLMDDNQEQIEYDGNKIGKIMVTCECFDIDKIQNGSFINLKTTLYVNYGFTETSYQSDFIFNDRFQVTGVNESNKSFSFYIDKKIPLNVEKIVTAENNENNVYLYFTDYHYFGVDDNIIDDNLTQKIPIYFIYPNNNGEIIEKTINFKYFSPNILVASYNEFLENDQEDFYNLIFNSQISEDIANNTYVYVKRDDDTIKLTQEEYDLLEENDKKFYNVNNNEKEGDLLNITIIRDTFLFKENANYEFSFERPLTDIKIPIVNTFETTLQQLELLNEYFVDTEKKKAINNITDMEKDVYYPCICNNNSFTDVYKIKFNLHFREHRGNDWLVANECFWNGVQINNDNKAEIVEIEDKKITNDNLSDLLTFLNFNNEDVHYQKNRLKKSFLRLMYFDSTNSANQNMLGYSIIYCNTNNLFTKYTKNIQKGGYCAINASKNLYGVYNPSSADKIGIKVDRENWDDQTRLSSQFVVKDKNLSTSSSEGFYLYIWKDNSMALPQDLYMKVEFNHAGYGRTIPFMMPYWDKKKWTNKEGIKTFQEILDDWNNEDETTDGHYGIRQYTKFSYIHLKYKYDKDNDKHIYYIDPDTYGDIDFPTDEDGNKYIEINLYEAKVE
jgi:hypothetical protein